MPIVSNPEEKEIGEIFISVPYVTRWCEANGSTVDVRLPELICHGICHCLGYDHETDNDFRIMRRKEVSMMKKLSEYMQSHQHTG
jgi:probable rRNA maturation factor